MKKNHKVCMNPVNVSSELVKVDLPSPFANIFCLWGF